MTTETQDPIIAQFLSRIPKDVAATFTDGQLDAVKMAFGARSRVGHAVDIRLSLPMIWHRYYVVLLGGRERRSAERLSMERVAKPIATAASMVVVVAFLLMFAASTFAVLYTGKRALGINVVPGVDMLPDKGIERALK